MLDQTGIFHEVLTRREEDHVQQYAIHCKEKKKKKKEEEERRRRKMFLKKRG